VLVEFLPDVTFEAVASAVRRLGSAGYSPVLAHVERYDCLMRHPERIHRLKQIADVIAQMDCEILLRRRGLFFARKIDKLFRLGAIDAVATDAHDIGLRRVNFADGYAALCERYGVETAERLCWRNVMKIFDSVDKRNDRVTVN
jgi:protein-tyrosine phosphatase